MKVVALILVVMGAIGVVGSTTAPAPDASASTLTTTTTTTTTAPLRDTYERPPRMAAHIAPVAAPAKSHRATPKVTHKAHRATHKAVKRTVVRTHYVSSAGCHATCQWKKTASVWAKYPAWVGTFALCVAHHESWSPHMWTAENPYSTASGGFQWIDGSWRVNLARSGHTGPGHAAYASPILQAQVTAWVITHKGQRNWAGAHCGYGT